LGQPRGSGYAHISVNFDSNNLCHGFTWYYDGGEYRSVYLSKYLDTVDYVDYLDTFWSDTTTDIDEVFAYTDAVITTEEGLDQEGPHEKVNVFSRTYDTISGSGKVGFLYRDGDIGQKWSEVIKSDPMAATPENPRLDAFSWRRDQYGGIHMVTYVTDNTGFPPFNLIWV
jgi:hypothetical protein